MREKMLKKIKKLLKMQNREITELCPYCEIKVVAHIWTAGPDMTVEIDDAYCKKAGYSEDRTKIATMDGMYEMLQCDKRCPKDNGVCYAVCKAEQNE